MSAQSNLPHIPELTGEKYPGPENPYTETEDNAAELVRVILPLMAKHHVPANPRNFAIWYEYAAGRNRSLVEEIDRILQRQEPFVPQHTRDLYQRYIAPFDADRLEKTNDELHNVVDRTLTEVKTLSRDTQNSEKHLHRQATQLEALAPEADTRAILNDVIQETRRLATSTHRLHDRLNEAQDEVDRLKKELRSVKETARKDILTDVLRRDVIERELSNAVSEAGENGGPVSVVLFDVDRFTEINQKFGHLVGDKILRFVSRAVVGKVPEGTNVGRFGPDEFAVLLPGLPLTAAAHLAESTVQAVAKTRLKRKDTGRALDAVTLSAGVSSHRTGETSERLLRRAEICLTSAQERKGSYVVDDDSLPIELGEG
ncbi:MAG: diguanylate cyclase [Chromatiales bacterium]|nr:diguanylate cyclase [Chromatiales bacterium]